MEQNPRLAASSARPPQDAPAMLRLEPPRLEGLLATFARTRDAAVLGQVFDAAHQPLWHVAHAVTRDSGLAEDAVQDVFVDLLRLGTRYDPTRPALPWLAGMVRRKALKALRSARRRPDPLRLPSREVVESPVDVPADVSADAQPVFEALAKTGAPYRSAALLRWRYGLAPEEISRLRAEPAGTTRSLLSRALSQLRSIASTLLALFGLATAGRLAWDLACGPARAFRALWRGQSLAGTGGTSMAGSTALAAIAGLAGFLVTAAVLPPAPAHATISDASEMVFDRNIPEDWSVIHRRRPAGEPVSARDSDGDDPGVDPTR